MGTSVRHRFAVQDGHLPMPCRVALSMRMTLSENSAHPRVKPEGMLFGVMLFRLHMTLSENRYPLFGVMRDAS